MRSLRRHEGMRRARWCAHAAAHPRHSRTTAWRASPPCGRHGRPRARRHPHPFAQPHPRVGAPRRPDHRNDRRATDPSEATLTAAHPPACTPPPRTRRACPHPPAHAAHSRGSCGRTSPHAQATPAVKTPALLTPALSAVAQTVCPTHTPSPVSAPARPAPPPGPGTGACPTQRPAREVPPLPSPAPSLAPPVRARERCVRRRGPPRRRAPSCSHAGLSLWIVVVAVAPRPSHPSPFPPHPAPPPPPPRSSGMRPPRPRPPRLPGAALRADACAGDARAQRDGAQGSVPAVLTVIIVTGTDMADPQDNTEISSTAALARAEVRLFSERRTRK